VGRSPGFPGVFGGFGQSGASGTDGRSTFSGNSPGNGGIGGDGGNGAGLGGAIFVNSGGNLALIDSRFNNNFATANGGGAQGGGGAIFVLGGATAAGTGLSFNSNIAFNGDRDVSGTLGNLTIPLATIAPRQTLQESRPGSGQFVVNLSNSFPVDIEVNYSVGGTATPGQDHALFGGTIAIPAGQTSAILDLGVLDDTIYDPDETVIVTLNSGRNYRTTF
jgi:hypothetical protein